MKKITPFLLFWFACLPGYGQIGPIEVTGFNEDVIANGVGPMSASTTMALDAANFCYLSEDWKLNAGDPDITVGLPADGVIPSPITTGLTYQIPTAGTPYDGNNSLRIDQSGAANMGVLTLTTPLAYSDLYVLVTSGSTAAVMDVTVNFIDGTTQEFTGISIPDWYQTGLPVEISGIGRGDISNNNVETPFGNPKMFQLKLEIEITNQSKQVESIGFEKTNTGTAVFNAFAVSGKEADTCLPPYDILVSNINMTQAEISWSSLPGITEWQIEYGVSGFVPGTTGTIVQDTDGIPGEIISPLTAATQYDVYVKSVCGATSGEYVGPISFNTPICDPSEQCNYTFLLIDDFGDGWNGNSMSVLQNGILVQTLTLDGGDSSTVQVPICDNIEMELYWNAGGNYGYEVAIEILDPYGTSIYSKPPGTGAADTSLFTTTASCPEPPVNDNIENAIAIVLDAVCSGDMYSNVMASAQVGEPSGSCFDPAETADHSIWFTFVAPVAGAVEITTDIDPADFDSQIAVYNAPTDINDITTIGDEIACNQDVVPNENSTSYLELTGLTSGETYYIQVDGKETAQGNFCIMVNEIPCPDPSEVEIVNIMGNSAQVNWTANGIETSWQIEYGEPGFEIGSGFIVIDDDGAPGYLLTELSIDTSYDVYVSAICDGTSGNPIGPIAFTTPACPEDIEMLAEEGICGAVVTYNAPQSEDGGPSGNLIINPSGEDDMNGWTIEQSGGDGWAATDDGFVTSYGTCTKSQVIILADVGFTNDQMDSSPEITISEDYVGTGGNLADTYFLNVELRDENGDVVADFQSGDITTSGTIQTISHTFSDYGPGVRSIYFSDGGSDTEFWAGNFGSKMKNAQVLIDLPSITVVQTEGNASGEVFPVGTTTNTFEITQGNEAPVICTFNVTILDVENPEAIVNDITLEMPMELSVSLAPEDIDGGSTDNCEIASMSLDIVSLDCDDLGENEVTLTVTDVNGNTSVATAVVTLEDPNGYCATASVNEFDANFPIGIYPNPAENRIFIDADQAVLEEIQIFSIQGKLVKKFLVEKKSQVEINISGFSAGIYFVKAYNVSGGEAVRQVIKK